VTEISRHGKTYAATDSALVVARAVLLADLLPIVNPLPERLLIYNVAWKTLIHAAGAMFLHSGPYRSGWRCRCS
jgi:hypothetical protein